MNTERITPGWVRANQAIRLRDLDELSCPSPGAWPCNTLGNHDSPRMYNRYGDGLHDAELARLHLALVLTLKGTPFLYYGEEIGMTDLYLSSLAQFRDTQGLRYYNLEREILNIPPDLALRRASRFTRDKNRTPMQWSSAPNAGFSRGPAETWLPVNPDYRQGVNVADQENDPHSLLNFYRRVLRLRRNTPALIEGDYREIHLDNDEALAFLRFSAQQTCLVILNTSGQSLQLNLLEPDESSPLKPSARSRVLFSSRARQSTDHLNRIDLSPFEIYIAEIVANR